MADTTVSNGFLVRTRGLLRRALQDVVNVASRDRSTPLRPDLPDDDLKILQERIDASLSGRGGEASARGNAAQLGRYYLDLNDDGRLRFFQLLATEYGVEQEGLNRAMDNVRAAENNPADYARAVDRLRECLRSPRTKLFRNFNSLSHGVKFLVDMRADLRGLLRGNPELRPVDSELRSLLSGWFDAGFLELRHVTWAAPADLLEKLIAYEAVHEIQSWTDLKNRLESDRRCYAFFHPNMPDEPLIFVEVALVDGLADNVQTLLDESAPTGDPEDANTAIFYSISNAQRGLSGVSFGDFLIKQVVDDLSHELPNLKTFATLSPIPGFRAWLDSRLDAGAELLNQDQETQLAGLAGDTGGAPSLQALLDRPHWYQDEAIVTVLQPILLHLVAGYLLYQRRESAGTALDSVAHFHLSNGAQVERVNWLADLSDRGLQQSAGMMVNYLYALNQISDNHEAYVTGSEIPASSAVKNLL
ncbi:MAG: malonyl-CoA decarboxylase [Alphaproteobacteria bacterium]|nr:malonyl-CoA decarboxylase [Alphaproteobacteria bacterium]